MSARKGKLPGWGRSYHRAHGCRGSDPELAQAWTVAIDGARAAGPMDQGRRAILVWRLYLTHLYTTRLRRVGYDASLVARAIDLGVDRAAIDAALRASPAGQGLAA